MRGRKKKEEEPIPEEIKVEEVSPILSFDEFYSKQQSEMDFSKPCHPDWYMLGASASQYPKSDESLESPESAYKKYLKESK
jgi:hypothetical protein